MEERKLCKESKDWKGKVITEAKEKMKKENITYGDVFDIARENYTERAVNMLKNDILQIIRKDNMKERLREKLAQRKKKQYDMFISQSCMSQITFL